ncbi:hypothetical protein [Sporosarcina sp. FSL W7-1283]|uniref:hypothetical protein n=1 Tax=Sporosarcina sp. FSL W7-1283 TaxID=2921560 RepID=UPI0030F7BA15
MKVDNNKPFRNHTTDASYLVGNGFAQMLEKAIKEAEKEAENNKRIVERKDAAGGFDQLK